MYYTSWRKQKRILGALASGALLLLGGSSRASAAVDPTSCKRAIAKASATFDRAKLKALQQCEDKKRKGKIAAGQSCLTETKTAMKITNAQNALAKSINNACTGLTLGQIGWDGTGSGGNPVLARQCNDGERSGDACSLELQCPGLCVGGAKAGEGCTFTATCATRICQHANCIGGTQDHLPCDSAATKAACTGGGGVCNWLEECDGGSGSKNGLCAGGSNANNTCFADSDCPSSFCDSGCNTGNSNDCVSGYCQGALCNSLNVNKDCGVCTSGSNLNQTCNTSADCGKICSGHGNTACNNATDCKICSGHGNAPCHTAADCVTPDTCGVSGDTCAATGVCSPGTCQADGFCAAAGPQNRRLDTAKFCAPVDRCPSMENNNLPIVHTCDGGTNNGKFCSTAGDCPSGSCNSGCSFDLATPADVTNCVACVGEASVDQLNGFLYGNLKPATFSCVGGTNDQLPCFPTTAATDCPAPGKCKLANSSLELCKQKVGVAAAKFYDTKRNALAKCEDGVLKNGSGTCPDANATATINAATTKLSTDIVKACGGKDKAFGGSGAANLDFPADAIGSLFNCNNFTVPGGAQCAGVSGRGPISSLQDLVTCIGCVTEFKVDCVNRLVTPSEGAVFPECNPVCGNNIPDGHCSTTTTTRCGSTLDCPSGETCVPVETCDDGNAATGDSCPGNCAIQACTPSGSTKFALVNFVAPVGVELAGLSVYIQYPDGTASIPGHGTDQSVIDRVTIPFDAFSQVNDLDYAVKLAIAANSGAMFPGTAAVVQFDVCMSAPDPTSDQFPCSVQSASDVNGNAVQGVTCSVTVF